MNKFNWLPSSGLSLVFLSSCKALETSVLGVPLSRACIDAAIADRADIVESLHGERVATDQTCGKIFLDVSPHPFYDGDDGDEEHDADGHPKQGEGAFEFLNSNLGQCQTDGVSCFHP